MLQLLLVAACGFSNVQDPRLADSPFVAQVEEDGGVQFDLRLPPTPEELGFTEYDTVPDVGQRGGPALELRFLMPDDSIARFAVEQMHVASSGTSGVPSDIVMESSVRKGADLRALLQDMTDDMGITAAQIDAAVAEADALRDLRGVT